eukprot:9496391-Lingulodinium_polyedra.AAC.1
MVAVGRCLCDAFPLPAFAFAASRRRFAALCSAVFSVRSTPRGGSAKPSWPSTSWSAPRECAAGL